MSGLGPAKCDLSWRRNNVAALIVLGCLGAGWLVARWQGRTALCGHSVPADPARVAAARRRIDPNVASAAVLRCLPGIGPGRAETIVTYRAAAVGGGGRGGVQPGRVFRTGGDLLCVPGIGPGTLRRILPHLDFPAEPADSARAARSRPARRGGDSR